MANQKAIIESIKLLIDGGKDIIAASKPGESFAQRFADFENLIPDAMALVGDIGDIKAEIEALQPADLVSIAGVIAADLGFDSPKAQAVTQAALNCFSDTVLKEIPDVVALVKAIKS